MKNSTIYFFDSYEMLNRFKKQCDNTFVLCIGRLETEFAIKKRLNIITTDLSSLSTNLLYDDYNIFVHKKEWGNPLEACKEICLGKNTSTNREIRLGHNILKLFLGGEFG